MKPHAFTLVEVAACLVITGLVAAAATLSLRGVNATSRMGDVTGEIEQHLGRAREHAARFGRAGQVVFDLGESTIAVQAGGEPQAPAAVAAPPLQLPARFELASLRTPDAVTDKGRLALPISSKGWTPSFALHVTGPQDQNRWLFVTGLTGQITVFENEQDVERVFGSLESQGDDAG